MKKLICALALSLLVGVALAQDETDENNKDKNGTVETIVEGLDNPCGVAVQPGTGHVFVSDSAALRVVRIVDGKIEPVITGFPKDTYGTETQYEIGPLGLCFIDQNTLIVGGGGQPDGEDMLRAYKVPEAGAEPITADKMEGAGQRLVAEPDDNLVGEGDFYGVAVIGTTVYTTCNGDDEKGWLAKADIVDGKLTNFIRSIATKEKTNVDAPVAITRSPEGFIAVGQMGEVSETADSLLTFYDASEEELVGWKYETGLNDISALAYGPKRARLFATDFSWKDPSKGALYKLVADTATKCKAVKITDLDKPTSMAFDPEGNLYIAVLGSPAEGLEGPCGKLIVIKGLDDDPDKDE